MTGSRSDTRSAGRKPRLGEIATPGRVCPPHNETYDCRIRPNGIGCLRRRSTRRRLGCRQAGCPTGRTGAGIPGRSDIRTQRPSDPQRSVFNPGERKAPAGCNSGNAPKNEREKERRIPRALYYPSGDVPRPGRQNRKCGRGESGASASPGARKARATGLRVAQDRSFPTEMPDEPGISVKHSSTPKPKI